MLILKSWISLWLAEVSLEIVEELHLVHCLVNSLIVEWLDYDVAFDVVVVVCSYKVTQDPSIDYLLPAFVDNDAFEEGLHLHDDDVTLRMDCYKDESSVTLNVHLWLWLLVNLYHWMMFHKLISYFHPKNHLSIQKEKIHCVWHYFHHDHLFWIAFVY